MSNLTFCLVSCLNSVAFAQVEPSSTGAFSLIDGLQPLRISLADLASLTSQPLGSGEHSSGDEPVSTDGHNPWFLDLGASSNFTYLYESHAQLDTYLNGPLGGFPGYSRPREFYDLRRKGQLFTGYMAVGRRVNDWADLAFEFGGGTGRLKSSSEALPLKICTDLSYSTVIYQLGLRLYPFKHPCYEPGKGFGVLLKARPFVYQSIGISDITSVGEMGIGLRGLPSLGQVRLRRENWVWAYKLGLGLDIPVHSRVSVGAYGNYSFFFERPREFDGFSASVYVQFRF